MWWIEKKLFGVSKFWAAILNVSLSVQNFIEIQGPFPKKCMFFSSKAMRHCNPSSFYLPNMKKYYGTYQIKLKQLVWGLPCFLSINLSLPSYGHFNNATLRYAYSYFIWNDVVSNLYHMYLYHMYLSLLKTYMGKENLFNIKFLVFYIISLSIALFIMNNLFVGNNKLYQ